VERALAAEGGEKQTRRLDVAAADTIAHANTELPEAMTVPGYEILDRLGGGGMGVVYKARQLALDRLVALKVMRSAETPDAEDRARFRTEAETVAHLQHPNIVQVFDVGEWNGVPYLAMEFIAGGTLAEQLAGTPQPPRLADCQTGGIGPVSPPVNATNQSFYGVGLPLKGPLTRRGTIARRHVPPAFPLQPEFLLRRKAKMGELRRTLTPEAGYSLAWSSGSTQVGRPRLPFASRTPLPRRADARFDLSRRP
jgi:hypothetical protein